MQITKHIKYQKNLWGVGKKQFLSIFKGTLEFICFLVHRTYGLVVVLLCPADNNILTSESRVIVQELAFRLLVVPFSIF